MERPPGLVGSKEVNPGSMERSFALDIEALLETAVVLFIMPFDVVEVLFKLESCENG